MEHLGLGLVVRLDLGLRPSEGEGEEGIIAISERGIQEIGSTHGSL